MLWERCCLWGGLGIAIAQEGPATTPPPKVMQIIREFLRTGKGGAAHEKGESAFVQAFTRARSPTRYFAATALTGRPRVLFFVAYDWLEEAWEKDTLATQKNVALSAALDRASANDGELLSDTDTSVLTYNEEQSLRAPVNKAHMRYFEISLFTASSGTPNSMERACQTGEGRLREGSRHSLGNVRGGVWAGRCDLRGDHPQEVCGGDRPEHDERETVC